MYLVTGNFIVAQEKTERAVSLMRKIEEVGRSEAGIVRYTFYQSPDDPGKFFLFEEWESRELHDNHFNSNFMQGIVPDLFSCLAADPEVSYYEATQSATL